VTCPQRHLWKKKRLWKKKHLWKNKQPCLPLLEARKTR